MSYCGDRFHIHVLILSSHKWFPIFTVIDSSLQGFIANQHNDQFPLGMFAQLIEHCTGFVEVMVQIPYRPEFISGLIFTTASVSLLRRSPLYSFFNKRFTYMIFKYSQTCKSLSCLWTTLFVLSSRVGF